MLENKRTPPAGYDADNFEAEFKRYFKIQDRAAINGSLRTLYLMTKNKNEG